MIYYFKFVISNTTIIIQRYTNDGGSVCYNRNDINNYFAARMAMWLSGFSDWYPNARMPLAESTSAEASSTTSPSCGVCGVSRWPQSHKRNDINNYLAAHMTQWLNGFSDWYYICVCECAWARYFMLMIYYLKWIYEQTGRHVNT